MQNGFSALVAGLALCLTACVSAPPPIEDPFDAAVAVPDTTLVNQTTDLRIAPLDELSIDVFGLPDFEGEYQVDFSGRIKVPLIGEVQAEGLTAIDLAREMERRLEESYLQNADVRVSVKAAVSQRITVDGSVLKPGVYPIQGQLYLLQAVALAGGPSDGANLRRAVIFRQIEGRRRAAAFDLEAIRQGRAEDPIVYGNDIVVMDGSEARKAYTDFLASVPLLSVFVLAF